MTVDEATVLESQMRPHENSPAPPTADAQDTAVAVVAEALRWLAEKPTVSRHVQAVRQLDAVYREQPALFRPLSVHVLRNFTLEPMEPLLKIAAYRHGTHLSVSYSGYDPLATLDADSAFHAGPDAVVVALRLEEFAPSLARNLLDTPPDAVLELANGVIETVVSFVNRVRATTGASIFVHNFETPIAPIAGLADSQDPRGQANLVRRMNVSLAEALVSVDGAYVLDIDGIFSSLGRHNCYDAGGERLSSAPYSRAGLSELADAYVRHLRALRGPEVKCIVVDCDQTLWGGIVGEDGSEGLSMGSDPRGRTYREFQGQLLTLRNRGLILAICSKNNAADVLDVLRTHPDCLVREGDFAAMRINWDEKDANIVSIAKELNLDPAQMLFVDDNPVECDRVQSSLPATRVLQWTPDGDFVRRFAQQPIFDSLVVTDEDRQRTELYRNEAQRRAAREESISAGDYLRSLKMVATVGRPSADHVGRLAQLTQRTNQFNLTTRRYDAAALHQLARDPDVVMVYLELSDRFGPSGIVGCGIVRRRDESAAIDTLLVSCRVIGRGVEAIMVNRMALLAREMGAAELIGEYIPTQKNAQVAGLYEQLGFAPCSTGEPGQYWRWALGGGLPSFQDWFEVRDEWMTMPNGQ